MVNSFKLSNMKTYQITYRLNEEELDILQRAVAASPYSFDQELLYNLLKNTVEVVEKPYIAQRLNVFLAGLKHLPHDTEVCVESGHPAGWTYSEREGRVYIHQ